MTIDPVCAIAAGGYLREFFAARAAAMSRAGEFLNIDSAKFRPQVEKVGNGVAVLPINGALTKRADIFDLAAGAMDYDDIERMAAEIAHDDDISAVLVDISSPGGWVVGLPESAATLRALSEIKDTIAFTDTIMASAAFELASAAGGVIATPSAIVGSVGAMTTRLDVSQALADAGITEHQFVSGDLKGLGNPTQQMGVAEAAFHQERIDFEGARIRDTVAARFPNAPAEALQGQVHRASAAHGMGLIEGLVSSRHEAISIFHN